MTPINILFTVDFSHKHMMQTVLLFLFHFQVFAGNTDGSSIVKRSLTPAAKARFVRFYAVTYNEWPCLAVEIFVLQ